MAVKTKNGRPSFEQYQDFMSRIILAAHVNFKNELDDLEVKYDNNNMQSLPAKTVTFQVTEDCNLKCTYCYQGCKSKKIMTFDTAKSFIDLMFEESYDENSYLYYKKFPVLILEFIGGEPLLQIDLIDQIADYFRFKAISLNHVWAKYYSLSMISNGVLYFEPNVQNFLQKNRGRVSFGISLDGCKDLHDMCRLFPDGTGSYDLAEAGCIHYKQTYDENMLTKMTIAPDNVTWVYRAFLNLLDLKYHYIHANCVYEKGWEPKHATVLYDQLKQVADYLLDNDLEQEVYLSMFEEDMFKPQGLEENKNYCGSTGCMLSCDPDGAIFPCIRFMRSSLGDAVEPYEMGDIHNGIGKLPCHKERIKFLDTITRESQSTDECFNCPIAAGCGWCSALNYQECGTINARVTHICIMHKARSLANVYYWNKFYKKHSENRVFPLHCPKEWALEIITEDEYNYLLSLTEK